MYRYTSVHTVFMGKLQPTWSTDIFSETVVHMPMKQNLAEIAAAKMKSSVRKLYIPMPIMVNSIPVLGRSFVEGLTRGVVQSIVYRMFTAFVGVTAQFVGYFG